MRRGEEKDICLYVHQIGPLQAQMTTRDYAFEAELRLMETEGAKKLTFDTTPWSMQAHCRITSQFHFILKTVLRVSYSCLQTPLCTNHPLVKAFTFISALFSGFWAWHFFQEMLWGTLKLPFVSSSCFPQYLYSLLCCHSCTSVKVEMEEEEKKCSIF